jgi:hypothetical protein
MGLTKPLAAGVDTVVTEIQIGGPVGPYRIPSVAHTLKQIEMLFLKGLDSAV